MGSNLPTYFSSILRWGILSYSVSNFVFFQVLNDSLNRPGLAGLVLGILQILLPIRSYMEKKLWKPVILNTTSNSYDESKFDFVHDYDRENPVTMKKALNEWFLEMEGKELRISWANRKI